MNPTPSYIFCGDDFTGASDTLAHLARAGLNCRLFLEPAAVLRCPDLHELDAIGIATATRSQTPVEIAATLQPVVELVARLRPRIFHYKICSTFDSSPPVGSIGAGINLFRRSLPAAPVLIVGGQPSLRRYCAFSNLFAAAADGEVHRLDRHPTMAEHPVTPMAEADLRAVLASQGIEQLRAIHFPRYRGDIDALLEELAFSWEKELPVLADFHSQEDLPVVGRMLAGRGETVIGVGSSSVAEAYLSWLGLAKRADGGLPHIAIKPVFILAGSRSPLTRQQVEAGTDYSRVDILPAQIEKDRKAYLQSLADRCLRLLIDGNSVLAVVDGNRHHSLSRADIAGFTAKLAADVAGSGLIDRLCIAGGDTSSLALQRLEIDAISFLADIEPGLCLCRLHTEKSNHLDGLQVVLKGGQMGSPALFNKLGGPL